MAVGRPNLLIGQGLPLHRRRSLPSAHQTPDTRHCDCLTVTFGRKWEWHLVGGALRYIFALSIYLYLILNKISSVHLCVCYLFLYVCPSVRLSQKISKVLEGQKGPRGAQRAIGGAQRDMLTTQGSGIN